MLTTVSVVSLAVTAVMAAVSYVFAAYLQKRFKTTVTDKWVLFWLVWDALIHFFLEGSFVTLSLTGTVESSNHFMSLLWKEYGLADKRWLVSDPTIVSLEILTVVLCGPLCIILIYAICKEEFYRHWLQMVLCVCELYGGWMTFCPDWLVGSPNLVTDNWLYMWVYLVFFNGLWVVVPFALMYQSWGAMKEAFARPVQGTKGKAGGYNLRSKKAH